MEVHFCSSASVKRGGGAEAENEKMLSLCCQNAHGVRKKLDHFCSYFSHIEFNKIEIFY